MAALSEEDLERMAMEEIVKEAKRNSERAREFGSLGWQNPGKTANKRFLSNMLVSTLRNPLKKSVYNHSTRERRTSSSDLDKSGGRRKPWDSHDYKRNSDSQKSRKSSTEIHDSEKNSSGSGKESFRNSTESYHRRDGERGRYNADRQVHREAGHRNHHRDRETDHKGRESDHRDRETDHRDRKTDHKGRETDHRDRKTDHKGRENDHRDRDTDQRDRETDHRNREIDHRAHHRNRKSHNRHRTNGEIFPREGPPEGVEDVVHEDYMKYLNDYKKHMNYYEKMEENVLKKYATSSHSGKDKLSEIEDGFEGRGSSSTNSEKHAVKTVRKESKSWSDSDFSDSEGDCNRTKSVLSINTNEKQELLKRKVSDEEENLSFLKANKKSKPMKRKYVDEKESKSKKRKRLKVEDGYADLDSESQNMVTVDGNRLDSDIIADSVKGNNSDLCDTESNQKQQVLQKKKSKHKKHKHKKSKKKKTEEK